MPEGETWRPVRDWVPKFLKSYGEERPPNSRALVVLHCAAFQLEVRSHLCGPTILLLWEKHTDFAAVYAK